MPSLQCLTALAHMSGLVELEGLLLEENYITAEEKRLGELRVFARMA